MRIKKKMISFFSSKKVNVFTLFLVIALLYSVLTKLSKDYTQTIVFKVDKVNVPEDKLIISDSTHRLKITLTTYGFKLIKYYLKQPSIVVNFQNLEHNNTHYFWTKNREYSNVVSQFEPNVRIESIIPDTIAFRYDVNYVKKIPIILDADISFSTGYDIIDDFILTPDSIKIIGPKILIESIDSIQTEKLKIENLNSNIIATVKLKLPSDSKELEFSPDNVSISAVVERFTEGSVSVPVNIVNIPKGIKIKYYPKEVSVVYSTSLSNFKLITSSSFIIECDFNASQLGDAYLIPKLVKKPKKVKNVRLKENRIEFILMSN
jgi:hypothetical protein